MIVKINLFFNTISEWISGHLSSMNILQVSSHQEKDKNELAVFVYCPCALITLNYDSIKQLDAQCCWEKCGCCSYFHHLFIYQKHIHIYPIIYVHVGRKQKVKGKKVQKFPLKTKEGIWTALGHRKSPSVFHLLVDRIFSTISFFLPTPPSASHLLCRALCSSNCEKLCVVFRGLQ